MTQLRILLLLLLVPAGAGCAPKESFSWIDRNCFVADWTNHHSCISCCCQGNCQHVPPPYLEPVVLGRPEVVEPEVVEPELD